MTNWRIWLLVVGYGALYGFMGGLLALQGASGAIVWAVAMIAIHAAMAALLWLRRRTAQKSGRG